MFFKRETEGGRSFPVSTTRFWNSLPRDIKSKSSLLSLSKALTGFLTDRYQNTEHFKIN